MTIFPISFGVVPYTYRDSLSQIALGEPLPTQQWAEERAITPRLLRRLDCEDDRIVLNRGPDEPLEYDHFLFLQL